MSPEQENLLKSFEAVLQQTEQLKRLISMEEWKVFEALLDRIRREALEDLLASITPEQLWVRIGHAQCVNTLKNWLTQLQQEGQAAALEKSQLLSTLRDDVTAEQSQEMLVRYYGHTGV